MCLSFRATNVVAKKRAFYVMMIRTSEFVSFGLGLSEAHKIPVARSCEKGDNSWGTAKTRNFFTR